MENVDRKCDYDQEQERLLAEECILLDINDKVIGHNSKKNCHLNVNIRKGLLHRAFSVFLFNSKGELLLQQRSDKKITFPLRWTNTCCSHPLYIQNELEEKNNVGVKRAAQRKLEHELGIPVDTLSQQDFKVLTKIYYKAESDGLWGEHEIDYILFAQKDVELDINKNEVASYQWISKDNLRKLILERKKTDTQITPWFHMIANKLLFSWWDNLQSIMATAEPLQDSTKIHHLTLDEE